MATPRTSRQRNGANDRGHSWQDSADGKSTTLDTRWGRTAPIATKSRPDILDDEMPRRDCRHVGRAGHRAMFEAPVVASLAPSAQSVLPRGVSSVTIDLAALGLYTARSCCSQADGSRRCSSADRRIAALTRCIGRQTAAHQVIRWPAARTHVGHEPIFDRTADGQERSVAAARSRELQWLLCWRYDCAHHSEVRSG